MQKDLVVLAGRVQILQQPEQPCTVKVGQLGFAVAPRGRGFLGGDSLFALIVRLGDTGRVIDLSLPDYAQPRSA